MNQFIHLPSLVPISIAVAFASLIAVGFSYLWKEADRFWETFKKYQKLVEAAKTEEELLDLDVEIVGWAVKECWHRCHSDAVIGLRRQISAMRRGILLGKGKA